MVILNRLKTGFLLIIITSCIEEPLPLLSEFTIDTIKPGPQFIAERNKPVSFINNSTSATSFIWDFDDGDISTVRNPTHTYKRSGFYDVELIAKNGESTSSSIVKLQIGHKKLSGITLEKISFVDYNHQPWDIGSGPDILILIVESGNPDNGIVLSTFNVGATDIPLGGVIQEIYRPSFLEDDWDLFLIENDDPMEFIDENDFLMFTSPFYPNSIEHNIKNTHGSILITSGQNGRGIITSEYNVKLYWELYYNEI